MSHSRHYIIVFLTSIVSICATLVTVHFFTDALTHDEEDPEIKTEHLRSIDTNISSALDEESIALDGCNPDEEILSIETRIRCNKSRKKSERTWKTFHEAESATLDYLRIGDYDTLLKYTSCDAYDLSWYEVHCEADRQPIDRRAYQDLLAHVEQSSPNVWATSKWQRKKPNKRKFRNPRWVLQSRLVSEKFNLESPWDSDSPPLENGTIIMLEQNLTGEIYVAGIPITGIATQ